MMEIELSEFAIEDIGNIKDFIKKDSLYYAEDFINRIFEAMEKLKVFPKIGRVVPELTDENIREIFYYKYRILYRIDPDKIWIITIMHGARDLTNKKNRPWEID